MNEPSFPMDDDLNRFEQDLKSLTPKYILLASPVRTMLPVQDLGITSLPDVGIVADQQSHRFAFVDRTWLKTVSVAWVSGLAAGLLVPALWTRFMNEEAPVIEPTLISESGISSVATAPTPPTASTPDPLSRKPTHPHEPSRVREQRFATNYRYMSLNSHDEQMLHPFMSLSEFNWDSAMIPSGRRLTGVAKGPKQDYEQNSAPDSNSKAPKTTLPNSFPKSQGQRQLLKSLMETDDLISI